VTFTQNILQTWISTLKGNVQDKTDPKQKTKVCLFVSGNSEVNHRELPKRERGGTGAQHARRKRTVAPHL
jgi:hypothetical protein